MSALLFHEKKKTCTTTGFHNLSDKIQIACIKMLIFEWEKTATVKIR